MIKYLLFDVDDTLLDFGKAEAAAIRKTFIKHGLPVSDDIIKRYSEINHIVWTKLELGQMSREEILVERFRILFEELGIDTSNCAKVQDTYEYLLGIGHYFVDGAEELLKTLHGKYELYIVSNGTLNVQERRLKSAGIVSYFNDVFISESIGHHKPSKEFFDACFARIPDFDREKALVIGDRLSSDILGGLNAGVKTCWFNPKLMPPDPNIPADYEIRSLSELPKLIKKLDLML